jgi:hypothetical protein
MTVPKTITIILPFQFLPLLQSNFCQRQAIIVIILRKRGTVNLNFAIEVLAYQHIKIRNNNPRQNMALLGILTLDAYLEFARFRLRE